MASICSIFLCLLTLTIVTSSSSSSSSSSSGSNSVRPVDVHDLLTKYGFPKGLVPDNVESYTLSETTGEFEIDLKSHCYVHFDRLVYYDKKIKGKMSYGSVHSVSGIQAKKLFLWVYVSDIKINKDAGMIDFFVGPLSESLPENQFQTIPSCKTKPAASVGIASM
ncbi:uncharacterized protein [Rutidosis leptorrhynchoides]|uniref:uncharacterized protein n=1 Tax=Rutidosis leptorrhynchoides TaxID=125765 RepID=UPI003A9A636B